MREGRLLHASHRLDQLKLLLSTPKSLAELSERTGVSKRSVQRWIRALALLGVVVKDETQDDVKRFWIPALRQTERPTFGPADLISLELGAMAIGEYGLGFDGGIRDLAERLETNTRARRLRDLFRERAVLVSEGRHFYEGREEDWEEVVDATIFSERLEIRHRAVESAFHFDCYGLQFYKRGLYLVGFSHYHRARRTFGFDGLSSVVRLRRVSFERPIDFDLRAATRASFSLSPEK